MSSQRIAALLFLVMLLTGVPAAGQHYQPFGPVEHDHDWKLFAPADLGMYGEDAHAPEGFYFTYERVLWNFSRPVMRPTGSRAGEFFAILFTGDEFDAPDPYQLSNAIGTSVPEADFGWGNRFELGYMVDDRGWLLGVLGDVNTDYTMQFGEFGVNPGTNPAGTGSVAILFDDPLNTMLGFVDFEDPFAAGDGPDGFADDLDDDGIHGWDGFDADGNGVPDTLAPTDYDDLRTLLPTFEEVLVRNLAETSGVELMRAHRLDPLHYGGVVEFYYGARFLQFDEDYLVSGIGGTLSDSNWDTTAQNNMVGPQVATRYINRRGRWTLDLEGRFFAAYNIQNLEQKGIIGSLLVPSGLNQPLFLNPTTFFHTRTDKHFSPFVELRLETSYQLTKAVALTVGYTAMYADKVARASDYVKYRLPDMGLRSERPQDMFTNGVNFGIEINR
ncbi:MAG: BBP7 family outer membrane beta-barrel protein [Pirellulales bacterium]